MKKTAIWLWMILMLCFCCTGGAEGVSPTDLRIAVASDLHMQLESAQRESSMDSLYPFQDDIIDALLWNLQKEPVDVLLLTGDLTNSAMPAEHQRLLAKLRRAQQQGLTIYVLPGNHDIGQVTPSDFTALYESFGYGQAFSRDEGSMSYSLLLKGQLILMLDTNGYAENRYQPVLLPQTLKWIEEQLALAAEQNLQVLVAGHYPLLTEHATPVIGGEEAVSLFREYGMPLYLCGHLHGRQFSMQQGVHELTVEQAIAYPCGYALIIREETGRYRYEPRCIDVEAWARAEGDGYIYQLQFDAFQKEIFDHSSDTIVELLKEDQKINDEAIQMAKDFFRKMLDFNARGTLHLHAKELMAHPGYPVFLKIAGSSVYSRWVPSILENAQPYTAGFTIDQGEIQLKE